MKFLSELKDILGKNSNGTRVESTV